MQKPTTIQESPQSPALTDVTVEFVYHPDGLPLERPYLVGSWDAQGCFQSEWTLQGVLLEKQKDGSFSGHMTLRVAEDEQFWWGVKDEDENWLLFEQEAIGFFPSQEPRQFFSLGNRHRYGLHPQGRDGFRAGLWAPAAKAVELVAFLPTGERTWSLTAQGESWATNVKSGWREIENHPYGFRLTTSDAQTVLRADPYARVRQGPQRGVHDFFVNAFGDYAHRYNKGDNGYHGLRFEVTVLDALVKAPVLTLQRGDRVLDKSELEKILQAPPKMPLREHWWTDSVKPDGTIALSHREGSRSYSVCLGPEEALRGLTYSLIDETGRTYHDPWSQSLDGHHNWARLGLAKKPRRSRISLSTPVEDLVFYEIHIGSLLGKGGNLETSHLGQIQSALPGLKRLGYNAIALMPTNATEGWRDWGYLGTCSFAHQESYAQPGRDAEESLVEFIDAAHRLKMRVFTDVVYNHVGGFHNDLWEFDGLENCWFERETQVSPLEGSLTYRPFNTTDQKPRTAKPAVRNTPWGPIPAYTKAPVSQFYIDHAVDQVQRLGFDGIRFDFTHLIHAPEAGGSAGWEMLRAMHRRLQYFYPHTITFAEEFPPHPIITASVEQGGAGFTGMWNTEHQHRLIFDHHRPSITQNLVEDCEPPLDLFLQHLLAPEGFSEPNRSATVLSNHDEVGNAQRLFHIVKTHPRGFDIARLVSWFSLLCPGYGLVFQGTDELASNFFSWGLPHTWDVASHLSGQEIPDYARRHLNSVKDLLLFRRANPDLWANVGIAEFYRDSYHHVLGIRRGRFWIVGNFDQHSQKLPQRLTTGELVLSSERSVYGYAGKKSRGSRIGSFGVKVWRC